MTHKINALLPPQEGAAPWLYAVGPTVHLDLGEFADQQDWEARRKVPLVKAAALSRRSNLPLLAGAAIVVTAAVTTGGPAWLHLVGLALLALSATTTVLAFFKMRTARANMVVATPGQDMHRELILLARTLVAVHTLKSLNPDIGGREIPNLDQVNPTSMADMARMILRLEFPNISADFVQSVRADLAASLQKTTGVPLHVD